MAYSLFLHNRAFKARRVATNNSTDQAKDMAAAELTLSNPLFSELATIEVKAAVGPGVMHLCLPEHVAIQLGLAEQEKRVVQRPDGSEVVSSYIGPVEVRFGDRRCFVGAIVQGNEVLLGAIPMGDMDLIVHPATGKIAVNPASPEVARSLAKGGRGTW
jgi:clan AA aspartic protease